jgi:hypothetical protein
MRQEEYDMGRLRNALVAAVMIVGLGLAGCGGSSDDGGQAASTGGAASNNGPAPGGTEQQQAELLKYAQCMRENGVPDFPDPVNGRLELRGRRGGGLDPESPQFKAAQERCKDVEPPGLAQQGQSGERQEQMLKYVRCMRENGVPNFPDPQPDGRLVIDGRALGMNPESPTFKAAEEKCRDQAPGGVVPGEQ